MNPEPNPVLGTFRIDEIDGKRYKVLVMEEVPKPEEDFEIVARIRKSLEPCKVLISYKEIALALINAAIREENLADKSEGPYIYWWMYSTTGYVHITETMPHSSLSLYYPHQWAKSKNVIRAVVNKLGKDIFRIAAGVEK